MELAEAERAAVEGGQRIAEAGVGVANVEEPRDPVAEWEFHVQCQFKALESWARKRGCLLRVRDVPPQLPGCRPGREVIVHYDPVILRVWKVTLPGQSGVGPSGFFTPAGYLRRLRLSNLVFGDDVRFEGVLVRRAGTSLVTSQHYVQPHPGRFIPTRAEIAACLRRFGFRKVTESSWERDDSVEVGDVHDRNFIRTPDGSIEVIDVQPILKAGAKWDDVRPAGDAS